MEVLAIIPARGCSRGLPRKNVRSFNGIPLVGVTIQQAIQSHSVSRTVVSTDDDEIAEVAREFGAEVVRRPREISGDEASSEAALLHVLDRLRHEASYEPDLVAFLQCTSPIRFPGDIDRAITALSSEEADSLLSVAPSHRFLWTTLDGSPSPVNYDYRDRPRRQDRPPEFIENGSIYLFKPWVLRRFNNRLGGKIVMFEMDSSTASEIDSAFDFDLVRWIARYHNFPFSAAALLRKVRLVVLDFDGVLTDNRVLVTEEGKEAVLCSRDDGMGIELLGKAGLPIVVISRETNKVVAQRCGKLKIPSLQGITNKEDVLTAYCQKLGVALGDVAYVGNDVTDIGCMSAVGVPVAVADAHPEAREAARIVLRAPGGRGAVRELCDLFLAGRKRDSPSTESNDPPTEMVGPMK